LRTQFEGGELAALLLGWALGLTRALDMASVRALGTKSLRVVEWDPLLVQSVECMLWRYKASGKRLSFEEQSDGKFYT
jgi:hypothetical protein